MLAYIVRRLLLIIPTLFGILLINFLIIQAAPGGPVEQMIANLAARRVWTRTSLKKSKRCTVSTNRHMNASG